MVQTRYLLLLCDLCYMLAPHNTLTPALPRIYQHTPRSILLCHSVLLSPPIPLLHAPPHTAGPTEPSTPPLPPSTTAPSFASVVGSRQETSQSTLVVQDGGADFTVVDRKKMRKGTTERSGSKLQALRGTGVNIDSRWASTGIAKLWVSLPKQGIAMATISRRIIRIIGEHKLQEITIKRRTQSTIIQHDTRYMVHMR